MKGWSVLEQVVASLIAAAVLGAVGWGWTHSHSALAAVTWPLRLLQQPSSLPGWALLSIAVGLVFAGNFWRGSAELPSQPQPPRNAGPAWENLTSDQRTVFLQLVKWYGPESVPVEALQAVIEMPRLRLDVAIASLEKIDLIQWMGAGYVILSARGRGFAIEWAETRVHVYPELPQSRMAHGSDYDPYADK